MTYEVLKVQHLLRNVEWSGPERRYLTRGMPNK